MIARLSRGLEVAFPLCAIAWLIGAIPFALRGHRSIVEWVVFAVPPGAVIGVFALCSVLLVSFVPSAKPTWDTAVAWPIAFCTLLFLVSRFMTTAPNPLYTLVDEFAGALFWREPVILIGVSFMQMVVFLARAKRSQNRGN